MNNFLRSNSWDIINLLLLLILCWQLTNHYISPAILPLLSTESSPRSLHAPQAVEKTIVYRVQQLGVPLNTEDIIRELHQHPERLENNPTLKQQLRAMHLTQKELLQSEEKLLSLERELNQLSLDMLQQLTGEQKELLLKNRNLDSVQKIEQRYWQELIMGEEQP